MASGDRNAVRVLYSFPHRIGAARICTTAWYQVAGLAKAGAQPIVFPASVSRSLPANIGVDPTLAWGPMRLPYRLLGDLRTFDLHDYIVSKRLEKMAGKIDIVHCWPLGSLRTLHAAERLGIPTVLERPNAHTRYAYEIVRKECESVGVSLPGDHEHAFKQRVLDREEAEYRLATRILCPSDFVASTFIAEGFARGRLLRHQYGFDPELYFPAGPKDRSSRPFTMLFVGGCAPRKGLHHALKAWLQSTACESGRFRIAGAFVPGYAERLAGLLSHPSIEVLGHRSDVAALMRESDVLVLPSVEEGSALVTSEARGCGCVLVVSNAAGAICRHDVDALVHQAGDVATLTMHISRLHDRPDQLARLAAQSLRSVDEATWDAAGKALLGAYLQTLGRHSSASRVAGRVEPALPTTAAVRVS